MPNKDAATLEDVMAISGLPKDAVIAMAKTASLMTLYDKFSDLAEVQRLRVDNAKLTAAVAAASAAPITVKMSTLNKGVVSVYGIGRFPVSLRRKQWEKLLAAKQVIEDFIDNQPADAWPTAEEEAAGKAAAKAAAKTAPAAPAPQTVTAPAVQ